MAMSAPLFATAGLTHSSSKAFLVGLAASAGGGIVFILGILLRRIGVPD
jgi:hypothetical protein